MLHPVRLSPHSLLQAAATALPACLLPCLTTPSERRGVSYLGARCEFVTPSQRTRLTHPDPEDCTRLHRLTRLVSICLCQSQTATRRVRRDCKFPSLTPELNVATAHWRRNAADARLAAVMGPSLCRHRDCLQSSSWYSVRDLILNDRVVMSSLSTLSQSGKEIALHAIEGRTGPACRLQGIR